MGGLEATKRIRHLEAENSSPNCIIIAVTANSSNEYRKWGTLAGVNDFITKPYSPGDIQSYFCKYQHQVILGSKNIE